jgi:hypothetical protein
MYFISYLILIYSEYSCVDGYSYFYYSLNGCWRLGERLKWSSCSFTGRLLNESNSGSQEHQGKIIATFSMEQENVNGDIMIQMGKA